MDKFMFSNEWLSALIKVTSDVIYRMNPEWSTMTELYGNGFLAETEEPNVNWVVKYIHPSDREFVTGMINECIRERKTFELEYRVLRMDGSTGWTYSKAVPLMDGNGVIKEWFGVASDITRRKRLEQHQILLSEISRDLVALNTIEETMSLLCEKIGRYFGVVWAMYAELIEDNEYSIASNGWNADGAISLKGKYRMRDFLSDEQLAKNNAGELTIVSDTQADPCVSAETYGALGIRSFIILPISRDGQWRFQMSIIDNKPRKWGDDEVALLQEIADRIWARLERARAEKELRESEERLQSLVNSIPDEVWFADTSKKVSLVNPTVLREFGNLSYGESIEHIASSLEVLRQDGSPRSIEEAPLLRALNGEVIKNLEEFIRIPVNNELRYRQVNASPVINASGKIIGSVAVIRDITERKQFEEALHESEKKAHTLVSELEKADRNKNEFFNALSHELRNPLASISAGLQILDITQDPDQMVKAKGIMSRQVNQLCCLIDDLLDLTRITNNKIGLRKEVLDLNSLALSSAEDYKPLFQDKGVKLLIDIKDGSPNVNADPTRIKQIIGNLLMNALKFTNAGGEARLSIYTENNESVICVKDTGIGIKPEMLPSLFTPFVQADKSLDRRNGGLGLGLSISKGIAELHGGSVSAFSDGLGKGATFKIQLPLYRNGSTEQPEKLSEKKKTRPLKILLIEDNRDFADILCSTLTLLGHEVITAIDGLTGIAKAKNFSPDVIFCDIGLPEIDGFEVAKKIRSIYAIKDVFLIALTGYAGQREIDMAIQSGFNQHMSKPVDMETIKMMLNEIP